MANLSSSPLHGILTPAQITIAGLVLAFSNFIVILDLTVANVSVPHIAGSLGVSFAQGSWVITSYSVAEAIMVPLTGWLAGRFGSLRLYTWCMIGFGLFSLLCGSAVTLEMMVICRVGQGLCGGLIMPLAQTLLLRLYPADLQPKAIFLTATTTVLGPALGPNIGGLISDNMSWPWIFLINIPLVAICVFTATTLLKPLETDTRKLPIDFTGLILMVTWVGALQIMLDIGREHDWFGDPLIVMLACVAAVGFCAFLIWEMTEAHPIVDLRVFRHRGFTFGVGALSLAFGAYFAGMVLIPQWLQGSLGYPATTAGFVASCTGMMALTTSRLASRTLSRGVDPRLMVSLAVGWLACMAIVRSHWTSETDFWSLVAPQAIQGFGMSFFMMPLTVISLGTIPQREMASAIGLQNFVRTVVIGVATALALTVQSNTQQAAHSEIVSHLQPAETLSTLAAAGMSQQDATAMIAGLVDREAMTIAVDYIFLITAAVFLFCSLVVWLTPRPKRLGAKR